MKDASHILVEALNERVLSKPSYSLRAFARDLGISPQQLSNVMNGKRGLGLDMAAKITQKLDLNQYQKTIFMESLKFKFSKSKTQKALAKIKLESTHLSAESKNLEIDLFKAISNWHHFALIELIKLSKKRKNVLKWFSECLGISENETLLTLSRLERLDLIKKDRSQGWTVNQDVVIADKGISSESIRNYHRQILEKAIAALAFQNSDERYGSSSTIPFRVKNLERAKKMIQEFRLSFDRELSDAESAQEIYGLSIQFFRLTQKTNEGGA